MDKRKMISDIKSQYNGTSFLNVTEVAKYLGVCRNTARIFLSDLEYFSAGKERKYFIYDVVTKIYSSRNV